jgi:hypothetical protein
MKLRKKVKEYEERIRELASGEQEAGVGDAIRQTVDAVREAGKPVNSVNIAEILGIKPATANVRLSRAVSAGLVVRVGHGLYAHPEYQPKVDRSAESDDPFDSDGDPFFDDDDPFAPAPTGKPDDDLPF